MQVRILDSPMLPATEGGLLFLHTLSKPWGARLYISQGIIEKHLHHKEINSGSNSFLLPPAKKKKKQISNPIKLRANIKCTPKQISFLAPSPLLLKTLGHIE